MNCWTKIAEKLSLAEAEKKFKNIRTACGRYLKKKEAVPSSSARDAVSIPREFANEFANFKSENEKIMSFKNESLSCYFGLNFDRWATVAIKLKPVSNQNCYDQWAEQHTTTVIRAIVMIKWKPGLTDTAANKFHCLINFFCTNFGPSLCERCAPPRFFAGIPQCPRSITACQNLVRAAMFSLRCPQPM